MKTFAEITDSLNQIRQHKNKAKALASALENALANIDAGGRTAEWLQEKKTEIRSKNTPGILAALGEVVKLHDTIRGSEMFYSSTPFMLSQQPISRRLNGQPKAPAEDAGIEATSRLALMQELSKLSPDLLYLTAEYAKVTNQYGVLHLTALENNSRDTKAPGWQPIDLTDVIVPDQAETLNLLKEAKATQLELEQAWRIADDGRPVSAAEKITLGRLQAELVEVQP